MKSIVENSDKIKNSSIIAICGGIIISIVLTLIFLFIFSLVLTYSDVQENVISPVIIIITGISILIGSSIATIKIKKNGILNGAIIGGIYILLIYTISSLVNTNFALNTTCIIMIISGIVTGMIGGIVGVNK